MRSILRATTLENKFLLFMVENGCIISKDADIMVAFQVELPELFTVTAAEYEAIHSAWNKAVEVLPDYSIVYKQDWFTKENYALDIQEDGLSFLPRSFKWHFNERPFLDHANYLFLAKTTKEHGRMQSNFSTLYRGFLAPKKIRDRETVTKFLEAVGQLENIMSDSGFMTFTRLTSDKIIGTKETAGIMEKYFSLSQTDITALRDISLGTDGMKIGDGILCLRTLSDVEGMPGKTETDTRYEKLSADQSDYRLSFTSPVGILLSCNHIYNQYIFINDHTENLKQFEKMARSVHSLSKYSCANQINRAWIEEYLNETRSQGLISVWCRCDIMAWSGDWNELKHIKNDVGPQLVLMEYKPRHDATDTPTLFWARIPDDQAGFPAEESFYTFIKQALYLFAKETNYRSSLSPLDIKMVDRVTGRPLHIDISDLPMKRGIITNRSRFILRPNGSGKSFFTNRMVRQYYGQNTRILLADTGNSYLGLCEMISRKMHGEDGIYFAYTTENPIAFDSFYAEDGVFDVERKESIKTLILTLWRRGGEVLTRAEEVTLSNAVSSYIRLITKDCSIIPCLNTFYEYVRSGYRAHLQKKNVQGEDFGIDNFLNVLEPYYKGGEYDYLLNSDKEPDLLHKHFIVFELDNTKDHKILLPVTTIIIMEVFISKMRKLKDIRKLILIEEAWRAITSANMVDYIKYLYETVRKYFGETIVVTQEVEDIISSPIVKESIIDNSDCRILLDQRRYLNKFDNIRNPLRLTDKGRLQVLSINLANHPNRKYKEVWIGLGGTRSAVYVAEVSLEEYYVRP